MPSLGNIFTPTSSFVIPSLWSSILQLSSRHFLLFSSNLAFCLSSDSTCGFSDVFTGFVGDEVKVSISLRPPPLFCFREFYCAWFWKPAVLGKVFTSMETSQSFQVYYFTKCHDNQSLRHISGFWKDFCGVFDAIMVSKEIVFQRDATREHIKVCLEVTLHPFSEFFVLFQNFVSLVLIF